MVSIHAPAKGATRPTTAHRSQRRVSIHAPAKGATRHRCSLDASRLMFQSTLPRRERRSADNVRRSARDLFQSTLPRRERRLDSSHPVCPDDVSIHAPAKGATADAWHAYAGYKVSIHAPAKGATRTMSRLTDATSGFNPRSREGSDVRAAGRYAACSGVSIHAPAKGATPLPNRSSDPSEVSIHAPAKGATSPELLRSPRHDQCFNPRSREGSDLHRALWRSST